MDWEDIKDHFEYYWKTYVMGLVLLLMIFLIILYVIKNKDNEGYGEYDTKIEYVEGVGEDVKDYFSVFNRTVRKNRNGGYDYEMTLYLKKPFIKVKDLEDELGKLISLLKITGDARDEELKTLKVQLYDREVTFNIGAQPIGLYYYAIPFDKISKEEQEKENRGLTPSEVSYYYTVNKGGKIDYGDYRLFGNFRELKSNTGIEPLTDQEYEWFVKYDVYKNLGEGIKTALEWEYGVSPNKNIGEVEKEASNFLARLYKIGDNPTLFGEDNISIIGYERKLAKENPSLLLYMKSGLVDDNEVTARAKLMELYPGEYDSVINEWIEEKAKNIQNE